MGWTGDSGYICTSSRFYIYTKLLGQLLEEYLKYNLSNNHSVERIMLFWILIPTYPFSDVIYFGHIGFYITVSLRVLDNQRLMSFYHIFEAKMTKRNVFIYYFLEIVFRGNCWTHQINHIYKLQICFTWDFTLLRLWIFEKIFRILPNRDFWRKCFKSLFDESISRRGNLLTPFFDLFLYITAARR